jgi:hypothetical protein
LRHRAHDARRRLAACRNHPSSWFQLATLAQREIHWLCPNVSKTTFGPAPLRHQYRRAGVSEVVQPAFRPRVLEQLPELLPHVQYWNRSSVR